MSFFFDRDVLWRHLSIGLSVLCDGIRLWIPRTELTLLLQGFNQLNSWHQWSEKRSEAVETCSWENWLIVNYLPWHIMAKKLYYCPVVRRKHEKTKELRTLSQRHDRLYIEVPNHMIHMINYIYMWIASYLCLDVTPAWIMATGWISYNLLGAFRFRPWCEGSGFRCRIGDGALSGESKHQLRILLVWDTNSYHFDRQGHHPLGLTGFIQHWFSWQGQIAWLVVSSVTNLHW